MPSLTFGLSYFKTGRLVSPRKIGSGKERMRYVS